MNTENQKAVHSQLLLSSKLARELQCLWNAAKLQMMCEDVVGETLEEMIDDRLNEITHHLDILTKPFPF